MDAKTREALEKSIKHWEENRAAERPELASISDRDCALCSRYYNRGCKGCPVRQATGQKLCFGSPYKAAADNFIDWRYDPKNKRLRTVFRQWATREINFLKSLRPSDEQEAA